MNHSPDPVMPIAAGRTVPVRPFMGFAALVLIIAVAWVFLPGGEETQADPTARPQQHDRADGGLSSSSTAAAEGLPVPGSARSGETRADPFGPGGTTRYTVDGASTSDVITWYQERVPYGSNFGEWSWCSSSDSYQLGEHGSYRSWVRGGFLLEVTISDAFPGQGTEIEIARKTASAGCDY